MKRRSFLSAVALSVLVAAAGLPAQPASAAPAERGRRPLNIAPFLPAIQSISAARVAELDGMLAMATIPQLQAMLAQGRLSSEELVTYYLWRINQYDLNKLNSVTELNPDALAIAQALDAERAAGAVRGPLHGTVVLIKDNIATGDGMHTTAGARAMQDAKADRDAFLVKKLRDAGAIVLGKTGLSEWANSMGEGMPNGFSTVNGQVVNAYDAKTDPIGSSTGSAVATSANFATFTIGTETWGSLIAPAVANSDVTIKPSVGLISRDRVIPLLDFTDTAGPMTRNVTDLAVVMNTLVGHDANDPVTAASINRKGRFDDGLNLDQLKGMRVGVLPTDDAVFDPFQQKLIGMLTAAGAKVIMLPKQPDPYVTYGPQLIDAVFAYYQKHGTDEYLAATNAPFKTVKEITAFNKQDPKDRMPYGQKWLQMAADSTMTPAEYAKAKQELAARAAKDIDALMAKDKLDMIASTHLAVFPNLFYPGPGYPAVAIQGGYQASGAPVGFTLTGKLFDDWKLVRAAYVLEQIGKAYQPPALK
jgi:amidase